MATLEELGQKVKQKYPGQYDDMSDTDLAAKIKTKFPGAYDDYSAAATPAKPQHTFLSALAGSMGGYDPSAYKELPGLAADAVTGAVKSAAKHVTNLSQPIRNAFPVLNKLPSYQMDVESRNPSEAQGAALESAGEFLLPSKAIGTGVKALKGATAGMRYAAPIAAGGRAALEALGAGAVGGAQSGNLKDAAKTAAVAGGTSAALSAAGALIPSAERVYLSALKPRKPVGLQSPQKIVEAQEAVARTGLSEGIPVSKGGLQKAEGITEQLNQQIADKIARKSDELGPVIDPESVASRIDPLRKDFTNQVNPESDLAALDKSRAEYLRKYTPIPPQPEAAPTLYGPNDQPLPGPPEAPPPQPQPITLSQSQSDKQGTYRQLRKKYGELGSADTEAQKALARGNKEEVLRHAPEVAPLNQRDSEVIALEEQLANFVKRHNTRDLLDLKAAVLGSAMAGSSGAAGGYHEGGLAGAAKGGVVGALLGAAMGNPNIKSRLAMALNSAAPLGPAIQSVAPRAAAAAATIPQPPQYARGGVVIPKMPKPVVKSGPPQYR